MHTNELVNEVDQNIEWFCNKVIIPVPLNDKDKDKVMKRMMNLGWLRQSEYDLYKEITKKD